MPNAYEFAYGNVIFEEPDGTPIFETADDLGLWMCEDSEPSPEPKWVRVDVPGADGSVDLSRALTGQVQYERRSIAMRFAGKEADHATALALVHSMRRALHGARVRMTTMLTAQVGGYYIADCECDGTADAGGGVEVTVTATADPFIRIGTQTLALPAGNASRTDLSPVVLPANGHDGTTGGQGDSSYFMQPFGVEGSRVCPVGADVARMWWARGANMLDAGMWPYATKGDLFAPGVNGQAIFMSVGTYLTPGDATFQLKASDRTGTWPAWPYSFPFSCFADRPASLVEAAGQRLLAYVTGTVTAVGSSPSVTVTAVADGTGTDADGFVQGTTASASAALATGAVSQALSIDLGAATWSASGAMALSAITIAVEDASATLTVRLMLTCDGTATNWAAADLGYADVTLPAPVGWYETIGHSDAIRVAPVGATCTNRVEHADGVATDYDASATAKPATATGLPPTDDTESVWVTFALMADGGPSGAVALWAETPARSVATGTNTTMRSVPTITSEEGAAITIDGRTAIVGPGTVELPAITIPGGTFSAVYMLYGLTPDDGTLTWEGGAL